MKLTYVLVVCYTNPEKEGIVMSVFIPLWIAEALFAALFIVFGYPDATKKGFVCKMVACVLYIANGIYAWSLCGHASYGVMILTGLAGGLVGDVFLALDPFLQRKNNRKLRLALKMFGGLFFLLGHAAYMIAFARLLAQAHAFRYLTFALAMGCVLVCFALVFGLCKVSAGKFTPAIAVYAAGLAGMCALAICAALLVFRGNTVLQCMLFAAPLLFAFSDATLALRVADKDRFESLPMRSFSLGAYFLAQMLLGLSIRLI